MNDVAENENKLISIWAWVAMILGIYGIIITGMGIYYVANPETATATAEYNPSLWWGILMIVSAGFFFFAARVANRASSGGKQHGR